MWISSLLFSATIALSIAGPVDYDELSKYIDGLDEKLSYGLKYSEQQNYEDDIPAATTEEAGIYYDTGVFTKYPESPKEWDYHPPQVGQLQFKGLRERRQATEKNGDASIDVNKQFFGNVYNLNRPERKTNEDLSISLSGFISAIEKQLVSSAQQINAKHNRRKRSPSTANAKLQKRQSNGDDSLDVNKNFFESLFEFTRPQREIDNLKSATIPLDGLVRAVESTLINSARNLGPSSVGAKRKRDVDAVNADKISPIDAEIKTVKGAPRPQRQIESLRVPLSGLIQAIESSLISTAQNLNEGSLIAKRKRSIQSAGDNPVDVSKHFSDRIQALIRPQRGADQEVTLPLDGLIRAIESGLVGTAQEISKSERADRTKRSSEDDSSEEKEEKKHHKKYYNVQKLVPSQTQPNLDLLNPITFKNHNNEELKATKSPISSEETDSEETTSSVLPIIPQTNITVVESIDTTHVIPSPNNTILHVQRQKIEQTIFSSSLAILPTIPPQKINVPLPTTVPLDVESETKRKTRSLDDTNDSSSAEAIVESGSESDEQEEESVETDKLREQIAEVQANPVILSTI